MAVSAMGTGLPSRRVAAPRNTAVGVVRCPTQVGVTGEKRSVPGAINVLHAPSSIRGLAAYTNTDIYLVARGKDIC